MRRLNWWPRALTISALIIGLAAFVLAVYEINDDTDQASDPGSKVLPETLRAPGEVQPFLLLSNDGTANDMQENAERSAPDSATGAFAGVYVVDLDVGLDSGAFVVTVYSFDSAKDAAASDIADNPGARYAKEGTPRRVLPVVASVGTTICEAQSSRGCLSYAWWTVSGRHRIEAFAWNWPDGYADLSEVIDEMTTQLLPALPE